VAVIQQGSLPEEKIAIGTVDTIVDEVEEQGLTNPALILIGEVVRLHPGFCQKKHSPKNGFLATVQKPFKELNRYMNVGIAGLSF
jgi:uroporphyrin-III C-methyltransferase